MQVDNGKIVMNEGYQEQLRRARAYSLAVEDIRLMGGVPQHKHKKYIIEKYMFHLELSKLLENSDQEELEKLHKEADIE